MRLGPFMYPSLVTVNSPIVKALLRASEIMLGKAVETYYSPSAFDQGYLNHVGIPTANFGAGEHQWAHTDYDMASVERTTDSARVYAFMMLDLSHLRIRVAACRKWAGRHCAPDSARTGT